MTVVDKQACHDDCDEANNNEQKFDQDAPNDAQTPQTKVGLFFCSTFKNKIKFY